MTLLTPEQRAERYFRITDRCVVMCELDSCGNWMLTVMPDGARWSEALTTENSNAVRALTAWLREHVD